MEWTKRKHVHGPVNYYFSLITRFCSAKVFGTAEMWLFFSPSLSFWGQRVEICGVDTAGW